VHFVVFCLLFFSTAKNLLDLNLKKRIALQTAQAMIHLHNQNMLHMDLKPANVLVCVDVGMRVHASDFHAFSLLILVHVLLLTVVAVVAAHVVGWCS
jgi:serine/threonine protein kinase